MQTVSLKAPDGNISLKKNKNKKCIFLVDSRTKIKGIYTFYLLGYFELFQ